MRMSISVALFLVAMSHSVGFPQEVSTNVTADTFTPLIVYSGTWSVRADHPWGGGVVGTLDRLVSHCELFESYFACEQSVNGKPQSLLVYTATSVVGKLHCRTITPDGLAGGRGDLTLHGNHWTYLDRPPLSLKGNWSRVENFVQDRNHIKFEEYESADEGKTWTKTNSGTEERLSPTPKA